MAETLYGISAILIILCGCFADGPTILPAVILVVAAAICVIAARRIERHRFHDMTGRR